LSGVRVQINSVLAKEGASLVLFPQEGPLQAPGTFWLIVLLLFALISGILTLFFVIIYGKTAYKFIMERARITWPARRMIRWIARSKNKFQKGKIGTGEFFAGLCREFRVFIGQMYMIECTALTAQEFRFLPIAGSVRAADLLAGADRLRFSGKETPHERALEFAAEILADVEKRCAEKERQASLPA
jgi:hypothetical protein